ncbi:peptide ABC transporter substrate-binding protein [Terrilactibacillus laevilacticus]|uniref:Peptide ABC transporter substrate-binding protein n=1 Tax=Terrilactibacillus laevilacticus TaxID=1380157 RepID=A0ABW5PQE8_9BACI|nr:peptide ABC transporter substrate-binding protein [Terrilactibacillus laevilacticus]
MKKVYSLFIFGLVLILILSGCSSGKKNSSQTDSNSLASKQILNQSQTADIPTLDSTQATDTLSNNVLEMVNAGLTRMHKGKVEWDLAAGAPQISSDKKTYTFTLRKGIKWSDGKPITAQNFVYGWQHENDPAAKPQYNFLYTSAYIKNASKIQNPKDPMFGKYQNLGIKAIGDDKVQIFFDKAAPPFFYSLISQPLFFPQREDIIKKAGKNYGQEASTILSNGPFKLKSWDHGKGWIYVKNTGYWNAKNIHLKTINVKVVKEEGTRINLYKTNKTDTVGLTGDYIDQMKQSNPKEIHKGLTSTTRFLFLNEKNKYLKNINLRKAINYSFDRNDFVNILMKDGSLGSHFVVPKDFVMGPDGKDFRSVAPDGYLIGGKAEAQKYWNKAKKELGVTSLNLTLLTQDGDQLKKWDEYLANQIETNLKGIKITINQQPFGNFLKLQTDFKFDISYGGWAPDYRDPMTYLDMFTTGHPQNSSAWSNKTFDQLIMSAQNEVDQTKRWNDLQQAEKILMNDAAIAPLDQDGQTWASKQYVKGLDYPLYGPEIDYTGAYITKH